MSKISELLVLKEVLNLILNSDAILTPVYTAFQYREHKAREMFQSLKCSPYKHEYHAQSKYENDL